MSDIRQSYIDSAMQALTNRTEGEYKATLTDWLGEWTITDIKARCVLQKRIGSPVEYLLIDGIPALEIHPIEVEPFSIEGDKYIQRITQKFRRLPKP